MTYRAQELNDKWHLQIELYCINGLSAWFTIAEFYEPEYAEVQMSDGAIYSAKDMAEKAAAALNAKVR